MSSKLWRRACPVVLPNASAFPEIIAATGGGRLFDLGRNDRESASALADALEALLANPEEARAMAEKRQRRRARLLHHRETRRERWPTISHDLIGDDAAAEPHCGATRTAPRPQVSLGNALAERSFTSEAGVSTAPLPEAAPKTRSGN